MVMQMEVADILGQFVLTRSPELREQLVLQSVPLVHYLLVRMGITRDVGSEYEDLAHQGLMGLIEAVDRYNPDFTTQFSTYAGACIRGRIMDYLRSSDWMPRAIRKRSRTIQKAINTFWSENMREPTEQEIANQLGIPLVEVRQGLADSHRVLVSLDTMMAGDRSEEGSFHEYLRDENQENPSERIEQECLMKEIASAIPCLSKREQLILSLYYNDQLTLKEIGKVLNITEARVCQLHAQAILTLKAILSNEQ